MKPLLSKNLLLNGVIFLLIGVGLFFFADQFLEKAKNDRLKIFFEYMGYLSAPIGLISYFIKRIIQKHTELQLQIENLEKETFIQINQLKIMAEFSYRFGQQAADIQNLKEQIKRRNKHE